MAGGASLLGKTPYRGFHIGFPGSGKTGAIVSLLNAGYKVRVLDYTGNYQPLLAYADPRALANLDIVNLQDKIKDDGKYMRPEGVPKAFNDGLKFLTEWKYIDTDTGEEINLGKSSEWGTDTIVVVDELTTLSKAAKNRAMVMSNKGPDTMTSAVWGTSVSDVINMIQVMKSRKHHMIINCHKQMLGPKDMMMQGKKDDEVAETLNDEVIKAVENDMIPTRFYPVGPTKPSSQTIHGELPIMLEFEKVTKMGKELRIIKTEGNSLIDTKIPGKGLKKEYPIETGLADIFTAMAYVAPGF